MYEMSKTAKKIGFIWKIIFFALCGGGVVKVEIYEVDTKIALYVDTFWLGL